MPEKDRIKIERLKKITSPQEIQEAEEELKRWRDNITVDDNEIKENQPSLGSSSKSNLPPVRGMDEKSSSKTNNNVVTTSHESSDISSRNDESKRISGYDFDGWEKYDVEGEIEKIDQPISSSSNDEKKSKREIRQSKELQKIADDLGVDSMTQAGRKWGSEQARRSGNDSFKSEDYEEG